MPVEWLDVFTRYVKRALEERGVPERNQPRNDDLIDVLVERLGDWLDWKRIDEFIATEARKRGSWAFREERSPPKSRPKHKHKPDRAAG